MSQKGGTVRLTAPQTWRRWPCHHGPQVSLVLHLAAWAPVTFQRRVLDLSIWPPQCDFAELCSAQWGVGIAVSLSEDVLATLIFTCLPLTPQICLYLENVTLLN